MFNRELSAVERERAAWTSRGALRPAAVPGAAGYSYWTVQVFLSGRLRRYNSPRCRSAQRSAWMMRVPKPRFGILPAALRQPARQH